ncbi:probable LRR receptor-like serine/threonine-protein kinase At1g53420 isoform X2 [Magnolia sinica]|uniref:probable LRR receptor-like serine/threonine-protein kinase At1g53420 isoform X2 n=1 Tax=Magnolia sinica TaxID=86752 RepID=UPI00265A09C4|nr:probable LRR receptor-like serine/threonine-protein kinase At1g53420 isoform X2 [Magnolia sinica]
MLHLIQHMQLYMIVTPTTYTPFSFVYALLSWWCSDLTRNLLSSPIPPEWATLPSTGISLMANRLSGPIPKEIGNIATLQYMNLEANGLSGLIPPELENLINLEELQCSDLLGEVAKTRFHVLDQQQAYRTYTSLDFENKQKCA